MASIRPDSNKSHDLGTNSVKWGTIHAGDVQSETLTTSGDVAIGGNLVVTGSQIVASVETVEATDPLIKLAKDNTGDALDIGFYGKIVDGATTEYVGLYRDASDGKFKLFNNATAEPTTTVSGGATATLVANVEGDISGNAGSADQLSTARTISLSGDVAGSVSFDGTGDVDIAATVQADSIENSMIVNKGITVGDGTSSEEIQLGQSFSIEGTSNEATVSYDSATNKFVVGLPDDVTIANDLIVTGTITGSVNANSATASQLETARDINLGGDLSGSVSFDGSQDVTLTATIVSGSVENSMLANDGISLKLDGVAQEDINLGDSIDFVAGQDIDLTYNSTTNALTVSLESTIDSDTTGNAATATILETSRNINISGDAVGSASFNGSANADIDLTISNGAVENVMLANDGWSLKLNGTLQEDIDLGGELNFAGTSSEVEVAYDSVSNTLTFGLPSTIVAALSGNASTASAWQTARTVSLSGDVSGSVSVDGSANVDIATTIGAGAVENSMLANSSILVAGDSGTNSIALGDSLNVNGVANETVVSFDAGTNTFEVALADSISGLTAVSAADFVGDFTGDLVGNASTASALETSRTIALSGDVTGSGSFDGSSNLTISTTLAGGTALTFSDGTNSEALSLGSTLTIEGTANEVEVAYSTVDDKFTVGLPSTITADVSGNATSADALSTSRTIALTGDVSGSVSFDGSSNVSITTSLDAGNLLTVGDGTSSEGLTVGDSLKILGTANETEVSYNTVSNEFTVGLPSSISGLSSVSSTSFTGDLTGNADTASTLETARTISLSGDLGGSVSFDGSANVDIDATIQSGSVENAMLANSGITVQDDNANAGSVALGGSLRFSQTANETTVVYDNITGTVTVGLEDTINANTTGNAATATALETARTLAISGDVAGSASFDGSANATIVATIQPNSVENSMLSNKGWQISDGTNSEFINLGDSLIFLSEDLNVDVTYQAGSNSIEFGLPDSIGVDITGNAATASTLQTARTLSISGDVAGSVSFDGSANADIVATIQSGSVENSMLANSSITFTDGTATDVTSLGESIKIEGTANEVEVSLDAGTSTFSVGLPSSITADVVGNASTATALETSRNFSIGSGPVQATAVGFDGTGNVSLTTTIADDQITNAMLANDKLVINVDSVDYDRPLGSTLGFSATNLDLSYSAGTNTVEYALPATIGSDTTGNAATATALETSRTLSLSGDVAGSVSFDGTGNADIVSTIQAGAVENSMLANDGWGLRVDGVVQEDINLGDFLNVVAGQDIDVAYNATTNALTLSLESTIDSDTTGNAATASTLQTARNISLSGDVAGSVSFNGGSNVDITTTIQAGSVDNAMLANSTINVSDGSNNENIALGSGFEIVGTSNEATVAYSALNNRFTVGLPDDVTIGSDLTVTDKLTVNGGQGVEIVNGPLNVISGSGATISGTTTINGTLIANSATMRFQDTIIEYGYTNTSAVDHGFHSKHSDGDFVGMVFDESEGEFVLFKTGDKPNTTLDRAAGTYETANLQVGGLHVEDKLVLDHTELTISSGTITVSKSHHTVDTEGDSGTDDLVSIGGGVDGQVLVLHTESDTRSVVVKATGNIATPGGTDFSLDKTQDTIMLMYVSALSKWITLSSSNNA